MLKHTQDMIKSSCSAQEASPNSLVRIAFIGCGAIANAHAKVLTQLPNVNLRAFWNRTESKAEAMCKEYGGDYHTSEFEQIVEDPEIDAVYLNNMHNDRIRFIRVLAENGKAIFSEKPLAHTPEALREIYAYLKGKDILFWSGYKQRFNTLVEKAITLVPKPEILSAHVLDETWPESGLNEPDVGGGNVRCQGTYGAEMLYLLAHSRPIAVTALTRNQRHEAQTVDSLCAAYEFANGAIATLTIGDAGVGPGTVSKFYAASTGGNLSLSLVDRYRQLDFCNGTANKTETLTHEEDGFLRQTEAFLKAVRNEGPVVMDFIEGAIPTIMVERAIDSSCSGQREEIDVNAYLNT